MVLLTSCRPCPLPKMASSPTSPPNVSADKTMEAVAQFEYAMALVVQKEWGTGEYMLSHQQRAESIAQHFEGVQTQVLALGTNQTA